MTAVVNTSQQRSRDFWKLTFNSDLWLTGYMWGDLVLWIVFLIIW